MRRADTTGARKARAPPRAAHNAIELHCDATFLPNIRPHVCCMQIGVACWFAPGWDCLRHHPGQATGAADAKHPEAGGARDHNAGGPTQRHAAGGHAGPSAGHARARRRPTPSQSSENSPRHDTRQTDHALPIEVHEPKSARSICEVNVLVRCADDILSTVGRVRAHRAVPTELPRQTYSNPGWYPHTNLAVTRTVHFACLPASLATLSRELFAANRRPHARDPNHERYLLPVSCHHNADKLPPGAT